MLFDVYGPNALYQWLGLAMVLVLLILLNEFARRTKAGGVLVYARAAELWPDRAQLDRCIASLDEDGLIEILPGHALRLPQ